MRRTRITAVAVACLRSSSPSARPPRRQPPGWCARPAQGSFRTHAIAERTIQAGMWCSDQHLEGFPIGDDLADAEHLNEVLEAQNRTQYGAVSLGTPTIQDSTRGRTRRVRRGTVALPRRSCIETNVSIILGLLSATAGRIREHYMRGCEESGGARWPQTSAWSVQSR